MAKTTSALNIRIETNLYNLLKSHCDDPKTKQTMTSWVEESIIMRLGVAKPIQEEARQQTKEEQERMTEAQAYHEVVEIIWPLIREMPMHPEDKQRRLVDCKNLALKFKSFEVDPVDGGQAFIDWTEKLISQGKIPVEILDPLKTSLAAVKVMHSTIKSFRDMRMESDFYNMEEVTQ